jgi:hypothetical protein
VVKPFGSLFPVRTAARATVRRRTKKTQGNAAGQKRKTPGFWLDDSSTKFPRVFEKLTWRVSAAMDRYEISEEDLSHIRQQGVAPDEFFEESEELSEAPSAFAAGAWTHRRLTHADLVDLHNSVIVLVPIPTNAEVTATRQTVTDGVSGAHHPIHLLIDEHSGQRYLVDGGPAWFAHFNDDLRFDAADPETVMEKTMPCTGKEARDAALSLALKNLDAFHSRHRLLPHEYIKHALYLLDVVYERKLKRWAAVVFNKEEKPLIPNRHYARYTQFLAKAHILDNTVEKERLDFFLDTADEEAARCRRRDPGTTRIPLFGWTLFKFVTESGGKGGVLSCSEAVWAAVARAIGRGTGFYDESETEVLKPEPPRVDDIIRVYVRARREERQAAERAAASRARGGSKGGRRKSRNDPQTPSPSDDDGDNEQPVGSAPDAEPGPAAEAGAGPVSSAAPEPGGSPSVTTGAAVEADNGQGGSEAVAQASNLAATEANNGQAAAEGVLMPQNLDAAALATAVVNSLADVGVAGGRPSLDDENLEEGQRQSLQLATLLKRDNPLFAALVETDAFKALKTMTESGDPGGEPICDDLDTCALCTNMNMSPVICRMCGNACCLPCVIQSGKGAGGAADTVKCLYGCGYTLATIAELKAAVEGGGPFRLVASVARNSLKRKADVAGLKETNAGLEEKVRKLEARVAVLEGSSDEDEGVAPPRSNIPSIP